MPKISVVIPIYNTQSFLARCLDSVLAQTCSDWECILVNDGSTDGSASICEAYCRRDSRFLLKNQSNQGSAAARNNGMALARGEYLLFLDSDDAWPAHLLSTVLAAQENRPEDLILWRYTSRPEELANSKASADFARFSLQKAGQLYLESHLYYIWNKLFHLELIRSCGLLFTPGITYGEDVQFAMEYLRLWFRLHLQGNFSLSVQPLYYYEDGNDSSVTYRLKPCYCENELWLTEQVLDWFSRDFPLPREDFTRIVLHLVKTLAGGLSVDLAQPHGLAIARQHLRHPTARRLIDTARTLGCYSPFVPLMAGNCTVLTARLGGLMLKDSRWYHRVYWAGWHLRRLRTGTKPPVMF